VCQFGLDDNETVSDVVSHSIRTSSASCSPRWIVHFNTQGADPLMHWGTTQRRCFDECLKDSGCVAVDYRFSTGQCYLHDLKQTRRQSDGVTQFEIVRQCYAEPST